MVTFLYVYDTLSLGAYNSCARFKTFATVFLEHGPLNAMFRLRIMAHSKTELWLTRTGQVAHLGTDYS